LGELGLHFFDYHRNFFFGFASLLSVLGVAMLLIGASALAPVPAVVSTTYWSTMSALNTTTKIEFSVAVGLKSLIYSKCTGKPAGHRRALDTEESPFEEAVPLTRGSFFIRRQLAPPPQSETHSCVDTMVFFNDQSQCAQTGLFTNVCKLCGDSANSESLGIAFSAVGKFVGFFGMQKRMYGYADSPSLKFMGILTELMGCVSLASTLLTFNRECTGAMNDEFMRTKHSSLTDVRIHPGPGWNCFAVGAVAAFVRLLLQILTPLPHRGKGILRPLFKMVGMCSTCKGCCVLYDDEKEEAERSARRAALHGTPPDQMPQHYSNSHSLSNSARVHAQNDPTGYVEIAATGVMIGEGVSAVCSSVQ